MHELSAQLTTAGKHRPIFAGLMDEASARFARAGGASQKSEQGNFSTATSRCGAKMKAGNPTFHTMQKEFDQKPAKSQIKNKVSLTFY